jgi:glycosyltransferase involved in cell wall biosynthesis
VSEPSYNVQAAQTNYCGTEIPSWATRGQHGKLLSTLQWLDVAINFHGGAAVGMMGQLRQNGIKTLNCLHLNDLLALGMPNGDTYLGLTYEHAFDYFVPCSKTLGTWLHGMGVPLDKMVSVQNPPGFEIDPKLTAGGIAARKRRNPSDPLRVLFLGRRDHQKGLDRLNRIIMLTRTEGINIEWRILGGSALAKHTAGEPVEVSALEKLPVSTPAELAEAYAWADAVVLHSRYENFH